MARKKDFWATAIRNIILLIPNALSVASNITALINFEARLAGQSLIFLVTLAVLSAILLSLTWACILALLTLFLLSLHWSLAMSLTLILVLNTILFLSVVLMMKNAKKKLLFPATRKKCRELRNNDRA